MNNPYLLSLSICLLLFNACLARPQQSQFNECQLDSLNALEPDNRIESEAGITETWNANHPELCCAGVAVVKRTIESKGLHLPSYTNAPQLIFIIQGKGVLGTAIPGCAETYEEPQSQQKGGKSHQHPDRHQKVRDFRQGDIIAIPAGIPYWTYNHGDSPLVAIALLDTSNLANQLDRNPRIFYLAGNPKEEHPETQKERHRQKGQNIFSGFDRQLLASAFKIDEETARKLQSPDDEIHQIVKVKDEGLSIIRQQSPQEKEEEEEEEEQSQERQGRGQGQRERQQGQEEEEEEEEEEQQTKTRRRHQQGKGQGRRRQQGEEEEEEEEEEQHKRRSTRRQQHGQGQEEEEEEEEEEQQQRRTQKGRHQQRGQGQEEEEEEEEQRHGQGQEEQEEEEEEEERGQEEQEQGRRQRRHKQWEKEEETREGQHRETRCEKRCETKERQGGQGNKNGLEETVCTLKLHTNIGNPSHADQYNPRAGRISSINSLNLPILKWLQLSAEWVVLYRNGIYAPHWNINANSVLYVTRGKGRVQVVNCQGNAVYNGELRRGQLLVVPQNFVVAKQAGSEGLEYIAFKTNDRAMISPLVGWTSALRAIPADVLANAFGLRQHQVSDLKYGRNEGVLVSPSPQSQNRYLVKV